MTGARVSTKQAVVRCEVLLTCMGGFMMEPTMTSRKEDRRNGFLFHVECSPYLATDAYARTNARAEDRKDRKSRHKHARV